MDEFICPKCKGKLAASVKRIDCLNCGSVYKFHNGFPLLFIDKDQKSNEDVTKIVKSFYEENPFPNYEDIDSSWTLKEKAEISIFSSLLNEQISIGSEVLEVGCGTGQFSNYLGLRSGRKVFGVDMCINSLSLAQRFKIENDIGNVKFAQMNLFSPIFCEDKFDLVLCNGVLHHTADPLGGFRVISKLVKSGGHIIIGMYNYYGRIFTVIRSKIFRVSGGRFRFLDSRLMSKELSELKKRTWMMDQYFHPHESRHTIDEVIGWFDESGLEFVKSIPHSAIFDPFQINEKIFEPGNRGSKFEHFLVQLKSTFTGTKEGGFFMMIGKKK